jgi:pimeloyl-ACP methyl ester carboxylesterase
MGGGVCVCYAAKYRDTVKGLVIISSIPGSLPLAPVLKLPFIRDIVVKFLFQKGMHKRYQHKRAESTRRFKAGLLTQEQLQGHFRVFQEIEQQLDTNACFLRAVSRTLQYISPPQSRAALKTLKGLPILLVWGTEDARSTYQNALSLLDLIGKEHGSLFTVRQGGHLCIYEAQVAIARAIRQFVQGEAVSPASTDFRTA